MSGSILGKNFKISTWGESHGKALGVVIDGCPAGITLSEEDLQIDLNRRKPGQSPYATPRKESDEVQILSGIFEGKTTGTPISMIIFNKNQRSYDYTEISKLYRPGHADYTYDMKYGFRDFRGGGRSSGRETAARVAAGSLAKKILAELGINILTYTYSIGDITIDDKNFNKDEIYKNFLAMPDEKAAEKAAELLTKEKDNHNSVGGTVKCIIENMPAGVGEPVFEKLDAMLGRSMFSIGAVKAVEIGNGMHASKITGWENNDFYEYKDNELTKITNNAGGIVGGISDGFPIELKIYFKPTPSIKKKQKTVNKQNENVEVEIDGRHDPIIVPRAVIVVESMAAVTLVDYLFQRIYSRIDLIKKVYKD